MQEFSDENTCSQTQQSSKDAPCHSGRIPIRLGCVLFRLRVLGIWPLVFWLRIFLIGLGVHRCRRVRSGVMFMPLTQAFVGVGILSVGLVFCGICRNNPSRLLVVFRLVTVAFAIDVYGNRVGVGLRPLGWGCHLGRGGRCRDCFYRRRGGGSGLCRRCRCWCRRLRSCPRRSCRRRRRCRRCRRCRRRRRRSWRSRTCGRRRACRCWCRITRGTLSCFVFYHVRGRTRRGISTADTGPTLI